MGEGEDWKKNLTPELKEKFILPQLEIFGAAASKKMGILPQMAGLAATLIAVATLNQNLVHLDILDGKILLSLFIILIPITLHCFMFDVEKGAENALKIIQSYTNTDLKTKITKHQTWESDLVGRFPWIILVIFYLTTFYLVFKIWWFS